MSKPLQYHKNWRDAPKDIYKLNEVFPVGKYQDYMFVEQMAKVMSHVIYGEEDELDLSDINPAYRPYVESLLPHLSEIEGGIYELAAHAARYVIEQQRKGESPSSQSSEEAKKAIEKSMKEQKVAGNRGGPEGGNLWTGKPNKFFFDAATPKVWPSMAATELVQRGTITPKQTEGKPKVTTKRRPAVTLGDLKYANSSYFALPQQLFWLKYVQREIIVNIPIQQVEMKQIKIVYLDDSSSMATTSKRNALRKIFDTLCQEVLNGGSVMYFTPFTGHRNKFRKIETPEEVEAFRIDFRIGTGGGTYLSRFLPTDIAAIKSGILDGLQVHERAEILIVNDGQDEPGYFESSIPIHAITVEEKNQSLYEITQTSGGQYFQYCDNSGDLQLL